MLLLDVGDSGSITAAAGRWSMTPSAASQRIARLERLCGQPLVSRHARGVHLTEAGEALCRHATVVRAELRAAQGSLASLMALESGRLRLGSFPTASASLVSDVLGRFRAEHPGVVVSVHSALRQELLDLVALGQLDMSVLWSYSDGRDIPDDLSIQLLGQEPTVLLASALEEETQPRHLADLREQDWLVRTADHPATEVMYRACRAHGFEPRVVYEAHDYAEMQAMVAAGLGMALVPRLALQHHRRDVTMIPLAADSELPNRAILLATHARREDSPAMSSIREVFVETARGLLDKPARPASGRQQ